MYETIAIPDVEKGCAARVHCRHAKNTLCIVLCTARLGSKAPARAWLSRAPAWIKSKPSRQWGLKLGSAWLKAQAAAWVRAQARVGDGEGDDKERHHNMGNRAYCDVVPRRRHCVTWGE